MKPSRRGIRGLVSAMPTDEERCEVAAELWELAKDYEKVPAWDVIAAGELPAPIDDAFMACGLGRAVYATEIFGRLADLIEPEERTCRDVSSGDEEFRCSEWGAPVEVECHGITLLIGGKADNISYCPNCKARVVKGDAE